MAKNIKQPEDKGTPEMIRKIMEQILEREEPWRIQRNYNAHLKMHLLDYQQQKTEG